MNICIDGIRKVQADFSQQDQENIQVAEWNDEKDDAPKHRPWGKDANMVSFVGKL